MIMNFIFNIVSGFVAVDFALISNGKCWFDDNKYYLLAVIYGVLLTAINLCTKASSIAELIITLVLLFVVFTYVNSKNKIKALICTLLFYGSLMAVNVALITFVEKTMDYDITYYLEYGSNDMVKYMLIVVSKMLLFNVCHLYGGFLSRDYRLGIFDNSIFIFLAVAPIFMNILMTRLLLEFEYMGLKSYITIAVMTIMIAINIIIAYMYNSRVRMLKSNEKLRRDLIMSNCRLQNLEMKNESYDAAKRIKHDIKNHLSAISGLVQMGEYKRMDKYIDKITHSLDEIGSSVKMQSDILTYIVNCKLEIAKNKGLDVQTEVDSSIEKPLIDDFEFCSLISNIMDNAVENTPPLGKLYIKIAKVRGYFYFSVRNSTEEKNLDINRLRTKKRNSEYHGIGLDIVKRQVNKNGGIIKIFAENGFFNVNMLLPYKK